jgi:predicted transcriptional regulator
MEVTLSPEQEAQLQRIARRTGRDSEALAKEAIGHLLDHEERFIEVVEKGLASLDRAEFISHQEVKRRIEGLLQS